MLSHLACIQSHIFPPRFAARDGGGSELQGPEGFTTSWCLCSTDEPSRAEPLISGRLLFCRHQQPFAVALAFPLPCPCRNRSVHGVMPGSVDRPVPPTPQSHTVALACARQPVWHTVWFKGPLQVALAGEGRCTARLSWPGMTKTCGQYDTFWCYLYVWILWLMKHREGMRCWQSGHQKTSHEP